MEINATKFKYMGEETRTNPLNNPSKEVEGKRRDL
jgi:hypothetical protein